MIGLVLCGVIGLSYPATVADDLRIVQATPHFYDLVIPRKAKYVHRTRRRRVLIKRTATEKEAARKAAEARKLEAARKAAEAAHASPKVSESVLIRFQDPKGNPVNGENVQVDVYDRDSNLIHSDNLKTGDSKPGVIWVKAPKLPVVVKTSLAQNDQWEEQDPSEGIFSLTGSEGEVLSSSHSQIARQLTATVVLDHPFTQFQVNAAPNSAVYWGSDQVGTTAANGVANVQLPKMPADTKVSFYITNSYGPTGFDSEADAVTSASGENVVKAPPFSLSSVNDVEINKYPDDSTAIATGDEIKSAYGRPRIEKSMYGVTPDGAEWWVYEKDGLSFKMRRVRNDDGKGIDVVESIRMTSPDAGSVASIRVGSSNSDAEKVFGKGIRDPESQSPLAMAYLYDGLVVHEGSNGVDWIELRRPVALLKDGIDLSPSTEKARVFVQLGQCDENFARVVNSRLSNLPGIQLVNSANDADLVLHIDETAFTTKKGNLLDKILQVPMEHTAHCSLNYSLTDSSTGQPALDIDGNPIDTSPVDTTAKADYAKDVEGGAILLAVVGVAGFTIKNPVERLIVLAAVGGTISVAVNRMKDTMTRAVPRTNELAVAEAMDPVLRSLERATLFRARVSDISYEQKTLTLNVGSSSGLANGMEFELLNENVPAYPDEESALKENIVVARVVDAEPDHAVCKLFEIKKSVNKKAYEDSSEKPDDEAITALLDPATGLVNARVVFRNKSAGQTTGQ